jgi:hypothetical protein
MGGVTRSNRHSACWLLLTTSETLQPFRLEKIALNSIFRNTLHLTLTRSRLCGLTFRLNQSHQDFRSIPGWGVSQGTGAGRWLSKEHRILGSGYYHEQAVPLQSHPSQQKAWMGHPRCQGRRQTAGSSALPSATLGVAQNDTCDRAHKLQLWPSSRFFSGLPQSQACSLKSNPLQAGSIRGSHSLVSVGVQICSKDLHV